MRWSASYPPCWEIAMLIKTLCLSLAFFATALFLQGKWIDWMHRFHLGQAIKEYGPKAHLKKRGTPSMGGVVALLLVPFTVGAVFFCDPSMPSDMAKIWSYPVLVAAIGLLDDVLKHRSKSSEGLRSLQKLLLQIAVTVPWACFIAKEGLYLTPNEIISAIYGVPLLVFLGVGIQNAVNVTDGLDGLAGGSIAISLASIVLLASSALTAIPNVVVVSASVGLGLISAFLWHNANPAELFMGDVGAHFWAGVLIGLCVTARFFVLIFAVGFIFGIEIITVAIQILAIRKFHRKIFKMSPLHHHFELVGWKETTIVTRFWLVHLAGIVMVSIVVFIYIGGGM